MGLEAFEAVLPAVAVVAVAVDLDLDVVVVSFFVAVV